MKEETIKKILKVQDIIHQDLGKRGISNFMNKEGLLKTAENMLKSNKIGIISGFCTPPSFKPGFFYFLLFSHFKNFIYKNF